MLDKLPTGVQRGEALLRLRLFSQDWGTKRGLTQDSWDGLWHPSWIPASAEMTQCGACRATVLDVKNMVQRSGYVHSAMECDV